MHDAQRRAMFANLRARLAKVGSTMPAEQRQDIKRAAAMIGIGAATTAGALFAYRKSPAMRSAATKAAVGGVGASVAGGGQLLGEFRQWVKGKKNAAGAKLGAEAEKVGRLGAGVAEVGKRAGRLGVVDFRGTSISPEDQVHRGVDFLRLITEDLLREKIEEHATNLNHQAARLVGKASHATTESMLDRIGRGREAALKKGGKLVGGEITDSEREIIKDIRERILGETKELATRKRQLQRANSETIREAIRETRLKMLEGNQVMKLALGEADEKVAAEVAAALGLDYATIRSRFLDGFKQTHRVGPADEDIDV